MLIPVAFADSATHLPVTASTSVYGIQQTLILLGFAFVFYFAFWRPQQQYQKERKALLNGICVGDVVYTNGGVVGKITKLMDNLCQIEVAADIKIYIQKDAVTNLVPKGSLKAINFE